MASKEIRIATADNSTQLVGWTTESPGRGTLSLVTTCVITTALCTWVVIHPRIDRRKTFRFTHKLALFLKSFLAPELIAVEAAQEWTQARRIVQENACHTAGELKLIHAFYLGMFGVRYRTSRGTRVLWPNQFTWLLQQVLVDWTQCVHFGLNVDNIKDKSNADGAAKLFAILQSAWFVAECAMRMTHHLPLAPLESMILGYIPLFAVTYFFWWLKPKDVETCTEIDLPGMSEIQKATFEAMAVSNRFDSEGSAQQTSYWQIWLLTPRVFEKKAADASLQRAVNEYQEKLEAQKDCSDKACPACREFDFMSPTPRDETVLAHWDPDLYNSKLWPITCLFGISFGALHLVSWDTTFPTLVEAWLWRAGAIASMVSMLIFMQFEKVVVRWQDPLMIVKLVAPAVYLVSRMIMIALAIAAFRASDPAIYQTYVVSTYWIHLI